MWEDDHLDGVSQACAGAVHFQDIQLRGRGVAGRHGRADDLLLGRAIWGLKTEQYSHQSSHVLTCPPTSDRSHVKLDSDRLVLRPVSLRWLQTGL